MLIYESSIDIRVCGVVCGIWCKSDYGLVLKPSIRPRAQLVSDCSISPMLLSSAATSESSNTSGTSHDNRSAVWGDVSYESKDVCGMEWEGQVLIHYRN